MNKLRALQLFVRLAELGSFTKVAELHNTSKSMISKEMTRLEEELGARLLHRTTRHITLTHAGEGYLQRAREILLILDEADDFVKDIQQAPSGKLKINIPMALGVTDLSTMFAEFMKCHPDIALDIHLSDDDVDLVAQGFDLGFRASSQRFDSQYVGRPLMDFSYHICAAPSYLAQHPPITTPQDLQVHNCFEYAYFRGKNRWPVGAGGEGVNIQGSLRVNNTLFMLEVLKQGLGIGFVPSFVCRDALASGELVELLAATPKPSLTLYALYPARRFVPATVMQCIEFLDSWFEGR